MAQVFQGFKLEVAGTAGGAVTITDMAVGYPTILTAVAHGLSNGDVVALASFAGDDAASLNGESAVVQFVTDDTFAVAIDTTGETINDNTDSATATPASWTTVGEITDASGPSGSAAVIDVTDSQDTVKQKLVGLPDEGQFTFSLHWDYDDSGQAACHAARTGRLSKSFRVTYSDETTQTFTGYVLSISASGSVDDKVSGSMTIEVTGSVTTT